MVNPCPGYSITTPYWKAGSSWGCGYHDGVDYASPAGTDVVAAWGGTVAEAAYPCSFGSAFGRAVVIDHDKLPDGSAGGWGLYAHLSAENVSVGQRVEAGQKIGDVGTTGNSSGNHLHFGIYMTDYWTSCGGKNPQRWIDASAIDEGDVYLSKLHYGQKDSDSVTRLQDVLNGHSLSGGSDLSLTGNYLEQTDHEVRLCQQQHGFGNDPAKNSSVGPSQAEHLFAGSGHTIHNDLNNGSGGGSPPTSGTEPAETKTFPLGIEYHYSGKPAGELNFSGSYKKLDVDAWAPKKKGLTFGMLYANVDGEGEFRTRLIRDPDDATAYQTHYAKSGDNYLLTHLWFESGEAGKKLWYEFCSMDGTSHTVTTRYAKFFTIPWDIVVAVEQAAAVVTAVSRPVGRFVNWVRG